jgi:superfamily II DNA or RNA helicase
MTDIKPRRYQEKAIANFLDWIENKKKLASIILPTGTGKTKTAIWSIKQKPGLRVLWVAHREELIDQAFKEFTEMIPGLNVQVEMAASRAGADADVIVGSVQTLHRNRKNIQDFVPDLVVVDEWHHYDKTNKSYHGLMERYEEAKFLGLTATPYRFIGGDLPVGEKLIEMNIGTAVRHGYLVPPNPQILKTDVSLADVKTRAGDFAINELAAAVNVENRNRLIAKRIVQLVKEQGRKGILYAVDVNHSKAIFDILKKDVRVGEVYGETEKEERRELMARIRAGEIDVLCNNLVATEGFDVPHLDFITIARPTKSLGLYTQMMGRGLRLFENKKDCIVVDVFDKVKITQARVTYSDVAAAGDMDGSQTRAESIIAEQIADKLENFPVIISLKRDERWTVDEDTWFAPAWILAENQWVITWTKRDERVDTGTYDYVPFKFPPSNKVLARYPISVYHDKYGEGLAHAFELSNNQFIDIANPVLVVDFNGVSKSVPLSDLRKREPRFERKKLEKPIQRAFYICMRPDKDYGRVICIEQEKPGVYTVVDDVKGDSTTLNEMVKVAAEQDDMSAIVRKDAKWRERLITDKQKKALQNYISWGKIKDDIDLDSMTGGDASAIMDQINWHEPINRLFGAKSQEELIGYDALWDDV